MDPRAGLLTCNEAFLLLITAFWIQKFKIELYRHDVPFDLNTSQLDLRWRIFFKFLGSLNWYDPRPLIGNKKITNQRIAKSWKIRVDLCEKFRPGLPINFYQISAEQLLLPLLMPVCLSLTLQPMESFRSWCDLKKEHFFQIIFTLCWNNDGCLHVQANHLTFRSGD